MMFNEGDIVYVRETGSGFILKCFGEPGTPLVVSKVDGQWVSIKGFPQDGSYTYMSINFEPGTICLENK